MGRPSDYSEELAAQICQRISLGEPLTKICAVDSMPCEASVYLWLTKHPTFSEMYAKAREDQADTLADQMLDIADDVTGDPNRDRLRVDTRKWVAMKLKPRKYGDKLGLGGADDLPPVKLEGIVVKLVTPDAT